jgi:hypothetical protein
MGRMGSLGLRELLVSEEEHYNLALPVWFADTPVSGFQVHDGLKVRTSVSGQSLLISQNLSFLSGPPTTPPYNTYASTLGTVSIVSTELPPLARAELGLEGEFGFEPTM